MNWEYIAGFFDGEGCISPNMKKYWRISISQKYKGILQKIQNFVLLGRIYNCNEGKHGIQYRYQIFRQEEVLYFLKNIKPFLNTKKEKCIKVINILENMGFRPSVKLFKKSET